MFSADQLSALFASNAEIKRFDRERVTCCLTRSLASGLTGLDTTDQMKATALGLEMKRLRYGNLVKSVDKFA